MELQIKTFDYDSLGELSEPVRAATERIKANVRMVADKMIEVGNELHSMKQMLKHGHFSDWLRAEFDWSQDTAERWIRAAKAFGQIPHGVDFAPTALYLLSSPKVPDEAREEAKSRAAAGEKIDKETAKEIKAKHARQQAERIEREEEQADEPNQDDDYEANNPQPEPDEFDEALKSLGKGDEDYTCPDCDNSPCRCLDKYRAQWKDAIEILRDIETVENLKQLELDLASAARMIREEWKKLQASEYAAVHQ